MTKDYQPTGKTYELTTYSDMMELSDDQFDMMIEDFKAWKRIDSKLRAHAQKIADALKLDISEVAEFPTGFCWIDDGQHNGDLDVQVKAPDGQVVGETTIRVCGDV